ncbi:hypothetical protein PRIPAC_96076 [Pristionchus pacificus]|uniref:G_PROTEIN_RECEP_F1_2 domain-containing protein n=1 Tax=Pristionchus pacificus TaxID=54126 RepID=A0A2A6D2W1_PRIPA|nr:hypothetical protein PRIPAC_96076 [Pristionchus pacificus]|eukprot:PDM84621.1 hypothetical protein PRIPAC_33644 [Pristionchus pacificus]
MIQHISMDNITDPKELIASIFSECESNGHPMVALNLCVKLLRSMRNFTELDIPKCNESERYPRVVHNEETYYIPCAATEILLLRWVFPILMLLCTGGNVLALLIYRMSYFDGSSSVHFLRAKALANLIFVNSRMLEVIHAWTEPASEKFEHIYWYSRSYIMAISNISGTMATWLTLLVTIETVMCIIMPFTFRQYCTVKMTWTMLAITFFFSCCLNLSLIPVQIIRKAFMSLIFYSGEESTVPCWYTPEFFYADNDPEMRIVQTTIYWTTMFAVVMLPTVAMLVCSIIIVRQFSLKAMGETFSQRRKCVIRMTVSTTLSHLLLEGPAVITYSVAALTSGQGVDYLWCVVNHAINLASAVNATIPFFVFLLCSEQFRHMAGVYIKARMEKDKDRRQHILSQAGVRYSARSVTRATEQHDRSIESKFMPVAHL